MVKGKNETEYKPSDKNTWPTGDYKYAGSLCVGNDGRDIEESEVISFDNSSHTATITTKDTIYCYLYFAEGENAITRIERLSSSSLEPEEDVGAREDVLRRFQGSAEDVQNNYICFGTSITEECVKNTDRYMYRIIGYATGNDETTNTKQGQLKLIKKEALNKMYRWWVNFDDNIEWPSSLIYAYITTGDYLQNVYYVPNGWENKIANHTWLYGDVTLDDTTGGVKQVGAELFKIESGKKYSYYNVYNENGKNSYKVSDNSPSKYAGQTLKYDHIVDENWANKITSKVGLIYPSDYSISVSKTAICRLVDTELCKEGWMNINNNDTAQLSTTHQKSIDKD